jgi:hypothetical protein
MTDGVDGFKARERAMELFFSRKQAFALGRLRQAVISEVIEAYPNLDPANEEDMAALVKVAERSLHHIFERGGYIPIVEHIGGIADEEPLDLQKIRDLGKSSMASKVIDTSHVGIRSV